MQTIINADFFFTYFDLTSCKIMQRWQQVENFIFESQLKFILCKILMMDQRRIDGGKMDDKLMDG